MRNLPKLCVITHSFVCSNAVRSAVCFAHVGEFNTPNLVPIYRLQVVKFIKILCTFTMHDVFYQKDKLIGKKRTKALTLFTHKGG